MQAILTVPKKARPEQHGLTSATRTMVLGSSSPGPHRTHFFHGLQQSRLIWRRVVGLPAVRQAAGRNSIIGSKFWFACNVNGCVWMWGKTVPRKVHGLPFISFVSVGQQGQCAAVTSDGELYTWIVTSVHGSSYPGSPARQLETVPHMVATPERLLSIHLGYWDHLAVALNRKLLAWRTTAEVTKPVGHEREDRHGLCLTRSRFGQPQVVKSLEHLKIVTITDGHCVDMHGRIWTREASAEGRSGLVHDRWRLLSSSSCMAQTMGRVF